MGLSLIPDCFIFFHLALLIFASILKALCLSLAMAIKKMLAKIFIEQPVPERVTFDNKISSVAKISKGGIKLFCKLLQKDEMSLAQ